MATRVVEWKKPYTWWTAIDIDENKVISLRLRDENNLIIYDEWDDEIYVDLQLPDEITPTDAFPIWVNTGRVVVDNGWDKAGTIISAKTTSWDVIKLVYADEGTLWIDNGTGTFKQIYFKSDVDGIITTLTTYINTELAKKQNWVASATAPSNPSEWDLWYDTTNDEMKVYDGTQWNSIGTGWASSNTKTFTISSTSDLTNAQAALDWYLNWWNPILYHERGYTSIPMPCTYNLRETIYRNGNYEYVFVSPAWNWDMESLEWTSESDTIFHCIWLSVANVNDEPWDTVLSIREFDIKGSDYFASKSEWFSPDNAWTTDQVLTKTANGYEWQAPTEPTVVSDDSWVTYHITVSNSDPTSWTASNIITLVP